MKSGMRRGTLTAVLVMVLAVSGVLSAAPALAHGTDFFPKVIDLPNGFQPEGISIGRGTSFYVGSLVDGAIYRGDVSTGKGAILVKGVAGRQAVGTEVDSRNRLWVAGGQYGTAQVYDAQSGALITPEYQFVKPGTPAFVNDVVITRDAAYFTDSTNPVLYVVPLDRKGRPGVAKTLPILGEMKYETGFNANGIEASPDGRTLLVVQTNTAKLYSIDAKTGVSNQVVLGGEALTNGDGLLRRGNVLYVVQNLSNQITAYRLNRSYTSATLINTITDKENFMVPTTVAAFGPFLYAVNARFDITPPVPPDTTYTVVRVRAW
jgi:sugar lactone lactonase YvrE